MECTLDQNYINFLRQYEPKIYLNKKEKRPYVGVVLKINGFDYFAPLSSPKEKHKTMKNQIDFVKIEQGELGVINLNNMIPVCEGLAKKIDIDRINNEQYKTLLINRVQFINRNYKKINQQAFKLYEKVTIYNSKLAVRCCNFLVLERLSKIYEETILSKQITSITSPTKTVKMVSE